MNAYFMEKFEVDTNCSKYLIAYFANNHKNLNCTLKEPNQNIKLCYTNHGVLIYRDSSYAWLFINDIALTGFGSEKLRWPSIKNVKSYGEHVLVETYSVTSQSSTLYVINIKSGRIVRLSNEYFGLGSMDKYEIINDDLWIEYMNDKIKVPISEIFVSSLIDKE